KTSHQIFLEPEGLDDHTVRALLGATPLARAWRTAHRLRALDIATAERSGVRAREWGDQIAISYPAGGDACQAKGLTEYGHKTGWIQSYNTVGKKGFLARAEAHTDPTFLALTEGPEDALTIAQCANIDTMAALGLHQIRELEIPDDVSRILLVGDAPGQDGERASLDAAKAALEGRGFAVDLLLPPAGHKDANDLLIAEGVDAVRAWVHGRDQEGPDDDEAARARREMHDALPRPGLEVAEATARANDAFHMAIEKSWSYVADAKTAKGDPDALEAKAQAIREGREAVKVADQIDWQHTELAASIHLPDRHAKAVKRLERLERRAERLEADPETLAAQYERRAGDIR
ncbi:MAG: toprim domain-containing protein, partial [Rhodospirillaceae bacterium]